MAFTGGGGATNGGFIFMGLKPFEQRKDNLQPGDRPPAP